MARRCGRVRKPLVAPTRKYADLQSHQTGPRSTRPADQRGRATSATGQAIFYNRRYIICY